jgi:F-type H+-transporting ATPase subunit b
MISTAYAGTAHAASEGGTFSDPTFWVAVAFVLFFVLAGKLLWRQIAGMLDKRAAGIAKALADAERLRADALKAKADAEATLAKATAEADAIVALAREEVTRMQARAAQQLENAVVLREQQAKDRIAQAEAAASKEVRDTAVDVALAATRSLLKDQVASGRAQALVDEAIAELPRRLH